LASHFVESTSTSNDFSNESLITRRNRNWLPSNRKMADESSLSLVQFQAAVKDKAQLQGEDVEFTMMERDPLSKSSVVANAVVVACASLDSAAKSDFNFAEWQESVIYVLNKENGKDGPWDCFISKSGEVREGPTPMHRYALFTIRKEKSSLDVLIWKKKWKA